MLGGGEREAGGGGWGYSLRGWSILGAGRLTGEIPGTSPKYTNQTEREGRTERETGDRGVFQITALC